MIRRLKDLSRRKFVRDTATLQLTTVVQGVTYLLTSVLTARYLGKHELGRWVTTREMYMFAWFLVSTGVLNATIKLYSHAQGSGDTKGRVDALAALLKIGLTTAVVVSIVGVFVGPLVGERVYDDREVGLFAGVLCLSGAFEVLRTLVVAALQGSRQMVRYAKLDMTTNVLRAALVWAALHLGVGIRAVVAAFVGHLVITAVISLRAYELARRAGGDEAPPSLKDVFRAIPRAPTRHLFGLSYLITLNKGMNTLVPRFGMLLIPAHQLQTSMGDNGAYSVAYVLAWALALALTGVTQALLPALGYKLGVEEIPFERLGRSLLRVSLVAGGLMATATLLSVPVMYVVVRMLYGEEFGDSFRYYLWLTAGNLTLGFFVIIDSFYIYSGKIRKVIPYNLLLAAIAFVSILVANDRFGPMGTAAAAGLCRNLSIFHLIYIVWYFRRARAVESSGPPSPP